MIVITGATGNTGKPASEALLDKGEKVRVVGRVAYTLAVLVQKGAGAFVGNVEDEASMAEAFGGAQGACLVITQAVDREDFRAYQERVSDAYASAVQKAGVRYVVTVSGIGAQHAEKTGVVVGLHNMEQ